MFDALRLAFLVLLFLVAATLRLWNINWDRFQHVHPDERFIVWVADSMTPPADLSSALDPLRSTLNPFRWPPGHGDEAGKPRSYPYGHFPLYLLVAVAHAGQAVGEWLGETTLAFPAALQPLHTVGRRLTEYNYLALVGRAISAVCDLATLALVYGLARRIYGGAAGLAAAAAYAFAVLPIQLSHFYAVDMVLTCCVMATLVAAVRWAERGGWLAALVAGAFAGLAVGSKFSAILLALPLAMGAWLGHAGRANRAADAHDGAHRRAMAGGRPRNRSAAVAVGQAVAAAAAAAFIFALTNPFALIELRAYVSNIAAQNAMVSGIMDAPYTRQYIGTLPYWYFIQQLSQWGLGWPLGLLAWGGFVWAIVRFGQGRAGRAEMVLLAWALPYFALTGVFHAKFLRYMAPLLPVLLIFAVGAAAAAYRWLADRWGRRGRVVWGVAALTAACITVGWALAFLGVYRQEHPWIRASRWIFANIPDGSTLLTEHWDDALPLLMDEISDRPPRRDYRRVELPLYDPDTPDKLDTLADALSRADYLILASNRLAAPIARLRSRYPMTSNYYRLLFAGELGYVKVAEFTAYPQLFGIVIADDRADESFTVYDHPRALIFQNSDRLSAGLLRARLGRYLPRESGLSMTPMRSRHVVDAWNAPLLAAGRREVPSSLATSVAGHGKPAGHARFAPQPPAPDAPLTLAQPVDTLPVVADFRWNALASSRPPVAVLLWWLAIAAIGWAAWPLLFALLHGLPDRGFGLARPAGWLLIGWVHWIGVSLGLWQNRLAAIAAVGGALLVSGIVAGRIQRRELRAFWASRRHLLLTEEAVFAAAFLAFVGIRLLNPDLWQPWNGGEKFMESAFLNAILRSAHFPPYDPYFAGGVLNYYYYGLYLVSLPIKLTGIVPEVAFNLAVPALFALTALSIFSVGYALASRGRLGDDVRQKAWAGAGLAVVLALLMGNLNALDQFIGHLRQFVAGVQPSGFDYWASSRVIPETINEFPFWTFLFADLHPHLIAMPFGMLVVGLAANWVLAAGSHVPGTLATILLLILSLGALGAINTWDLPTYSLLVAAALFIVAWRAQRIVGLFAAAMTAAGVMAAAVAAYWPFYAHYQSQIGRGEGILLARYLGWVRRASPLSAWLTVWGILLALSLIVLVGLWLEARAAQQPMIKMPAGDDASRPRPGGRFMVALALIAALITLIVLERPTAALMALPVGLALPLAFRRRSAVADNFAALLLALGAAVVAGTELLYLRDFLEGGDWYRMNTLFKFSVPAWLLLGLGCGAMLPRLWRGVGRLSGAGLAGRAAVVGLIAAGLLFVPLGTQARVRDRFPERRPAIGTLNGMDYMSVGVLYWPNPAHPLDLAHDYLAIRWLLEHVSGTPIIAEAPAGSYLVAGETVTADYYRAGGLRIASFTGFPTLVGQHQYEQRPADQVATRTRLGQELFRTTDRERTRELLAELRVSAVYVGPLERVLFDEKALDKFEALAALGELEMVYRTAQATIYWVRR